RHFGITRNGLVDQLLGEGCSLFDFLALAVLDDRHQRIQFRLEFCEKVPRAFRPAPRITGLTFGEFCVLSWLAIAVLKRGAIIIGHDAPPVYEQGRQTVSESLRGWRCRRCSSGSA